jgi:hypothetical protein
MIMASVIGCNKDDNKDESNTQFDTQCLGSCDWPEYADHWYSHRMAAGFASSSDAYLNVDIDDDGTFVGVYDSYYYTGTIWSGSIPIRNYSPTGNEKKVSGAFNFDDNTGVAIFEGIGSVSFTLKNVGDKHIEMVYPKEFLYTETTLIR